MFLATGEAPGARTPPAVRRWAPAVSVGGEQDRCGLPLGTVRCPSQRGTRRTARKETRPKTPLERRLPFESHGCQPGVSCVVTSYVAHTDEALRIVVLQ